MQEQAKLNTLYELVDEIDTEINRLTEERDLTLNEIDRLERLIDNIERMKNI